MAGYIRQSTMADGDTITAALFNNEYNQLVNAFSNTSGHKHDGTAAEGPVIGLIGDAGLTTPLNKILIDTTNDHIEFWVDVASSSVQQLYIADGAIIPVTDNDIDLGTSSLEFKDLYLDGTATIDTLTVDEAATIGTTLGVTGATTLSSTLGVTGATTLSSTLGVTGATTLSSTLAVTGTSTLTGNVTASNDLSVGGNLTVTGNATISGNLTFGDADTDSITLTADVASNITPDVDDTYDLGTATKQWRNLYIDGTAEVDTLSIDGTAVTSTAAELNILDGVTATAAEINTLDGITATVAELNILDGVTSTATELNIVDGDTAATATTLADADRVVVNDAGVMKQVALTDFETYFEGALDTLSNVTTVGALNAGSITSGFGAIDNGSSNITTTGTVTYGSLSDGTITITAFVDEDDMTSNSATLIPTQQSVKAYVDSQVTAQDLDLTTDSGTIAIDLDSETLTVAGGTGIDTSATANSVTVAIDSTVATLTDTQTLTNKTLTTPIISSISNTGTLTLPTSTDTLVGRATTDTLTNKTLTSPVLNTGVSGTAFLDDDTFATATASTLASSESIKAYVDSAVGGVSSNSIADADGDTKIQVEESADEDIIRFDTAGTERVVINATGNVGIGTTSPDQLLHISAAADPAIRIENTDTTATAGQTIGKIEFEGQDASTNAAGVRALIDAQYAGVGGQGRLKFQLAQENSASLSDSLLLNYGTQQFFTNGSEAMRIDSSGDVGIGGDTTTATSLNNLSIGAYTDASSGIVLRGTTASALNFEDSSSVTAARVYYNHTSDYMAFNTAQTERLRIDSSGNVGIGESNPTFLLDVQNSSGGGVAKFSNGDGDNFQIKAVSNEIILDSRNVGLTRITNQGNNAICIDSSARVGIGTSSPSSTLHLQAAANNDTTLTITGGVTPTLGSNAIIKLIPDGTSGEGVIDVDGSDGYDQLELRTGGATALTVDGSQNVGIGTSSPSAELHVKGTGQIARLESTSATGNNYLSYYDSSALKGHIGYTGGSDDDFNLYNAENSNVKVFTNGSERMRIDSSGNVGIRETSPETPLHVSLSNTGYTSVTAQTVALFERNGDTHVTIRSNAANHGSIKFADDSNSRGEIRYVHGSGTDAMRFFTAGSEAMRIDSSQKVIINNDAEASEGAELTVVAADTPIYSCTMNTGASQAVQIISCERSANSAYRFIKAVSGQRVDATSGDVEFAVRGDGEVTADGSFTGGGADYAEYFEWNDGNSSNEDRVGYSVSLVNGKIKIAEAGEEVIGVISGNPSVVGDAAWNNWQDKYLKDDFGRYLWEEYTAADGRTVDDNGDVLKRKVLNPDYDDSLEYQPREDRQEWDVVGLMGKLRVRVGQQTGSNWIKLRDISDTVEEWLVR